MKRKMILFVALQIVFSFALFAQSSIKNYANIKVKAQTYFAANDNMNFTNTASGTLEVQGAARLEGTNSNAAGASGIVVRNSANLLQNSANVNANVQQQIMADRWHLLSNPVAPMNFLSILTGAYAYEYIENSTNTSNAWLNVTSGNMQTDRGYLVKNVGSNRTVNFNGVLNNGVMNFPLNYTSALGIGGAGFNLVGNPFPCALDWNSVTGFDKSNITGILYIWDDTQNQYGSSNGEVSTFALSPANIIPANQGFIVKATSAANFAINNDAKTLDLSTPFYKKGSVTNNLLRMRLSGNESFDEMVVYFDADATLNYDLTKDADKFISGIANIYTLSEDNYKLAINVTNETAKTVPLHFKSSTMGDYTLWINQFTFGDTDIYLEDTQNNTFIQLFTDTKYNFTHSNIGFENRFVLHFGKISTDIENNSVEHNVKIYSSKEFVNIINAQDCKVEIFDVTGRKHFAQTLNSNNEQIKLTSNSIYIVKTVKNNILITEKVFIQ